MDELFDGIDLEEKKPISIGIDLGTVNSVVVKCNGVNDYTFSLDDGSSAIKSAMFFDEPENTQFGMIAESMGAQYPKSLLRCFKRGLSNSKEAFMNKNGQYVIEYAYRKQPQLQSHQAIELSPKDASMKFLLNLINKMNNQMSEEEVKNLVLTVPAKFSPSICQALRQAALEYVDGIRIVQEPVAAALYYDFEVEKIPVNSYVLVYDLGGGTFDISLLKKNTQNTLEYIDTNGDVHLGGEDFTQLLIDIAKNYLLDEYDVDLYSCPKDNDYYYNINDIRKKCNILKEELSNNELVTTQFSLKIDGKKGLYDWDMNRKTFEQTITPLIDRTLNKVQVVLNRNGLTENDIQKVILVGGGAFIPKVQDKIKQAFHCGIYNDDCINMIGKGASIISRQVFEESNSANKELMFDGIVQNNAETIGYKIGRETEVKEMIPRQSQIPFNTSIEFNLDDAFINDNDMIINFYSYDPFESKHPHTYDKEVEYIGNYKLFNASQYPNNSLVQVSITLTKEYILLFHMTINNNGNILKEIDGEIKGGI